MRLRDKAFLFICIELKTRCNSMNLYRVTFSLSKYSGYVYNSFKLKFVEVRLLSSCHSQLWKSRKVNSPEEKKIQKKQQQGNSEILYYVTQEHTRERFRLKT